MPDHKMHVAQVDEFPKEGRKTWIRLIGLSEDERLGMVILAEGDREDSVCFCDQSKTAIIYMGADTLKCTLDALHKPSTTPTVHVTCRTTVTFAPPGSDCC